MKKMFFLVPLVAVTVSLSAQTKKVTSYVAKHTKIATTEMQRTGVPASITLAQGIIESNCGSSAVAKRTNNHFGIKRGRTYKVYSSSQQSFIDHSQVLKNGKRYASLFKLPKTDYKAWAKGLSKAGYAKNPEYAKVLIACIERYDLSQYDE